MTDAKAIAEGLSPLMVECLKTASQIIGGGMQIWSRHRSTIQAIHKRGLCDEPSWRDTAVLTPLGLAVRALLERNGDE